jgi:hypothetical protein
MIQEINEISQIPSKGKVVVFVVFNTAPCKKFINYAFQAIGILEKPIDPTGGLYFQINNTPAVKESLRISLMPTCIIYVDGEEKKRFTGHYHSQFEIANMIRKGFSL